VRAYALTDMDGPKQKKIYSDRWVYVSRSFSTDEHVEKCVQLPRRHRNMASRPLSRSGMDRISLGSPEYLERLRKVKTIADQYHLEIIPSGFNTGYGGAILDHNKIWLKACW